MSTRTLPDGREVCDTTEHQHQHQLMADALACAFSQLWDRLRAEAEAEREAAPAGVTAQAIEASEIVVGDEVRLRPVTHPQGALYVEVTSVSRTPRGLVHLDLADGGDLRLMPDTMRYVRFTPEPSGIVSTF